MDIGIFEKVYHRKKAMDLLIIKAENTYLLELGFSQMGSLIWSTKFGLRMIHCPNYPSRCQEERLVIIQHRNMMVMAEKFCCDN